MQKPNMVLQLMKEQFNQPIIFNISNEGSYWLKNKTVSVGTLAYALQMILCVNHLRYADREINE